MKSLGEINMKKTFLALIITLLTSQLTFAAQKADVTGIINDEFFTHPDTIVSFRQLIPHDNGYMAVIDGTTTGDNRTISGKPFWKRIFVHNDEKKSSDELIEATVLCGTHTLERSLTLLRAIPYTFLKDTEEFGGQLLVGGTVTYYLIKQYERPGDKSIFREKGKALYELKMTLDRTPAPEISVCYKEWNIISKWQRKTRHARRHYTSHDIYHIITKYPSAEGMVTAPPSEIMSRTLIRRELTFKCDQAESPECGTHGGNLPTGTVII